MKSIFCIPFIAICSLNLCGQDATFSWVNQMPSASDYISFVVDDSGNVITTGIFYSAFDMDPGSGVETITPVGSSDLYVAKYNYSGEFVWVKTIGNEGYEVPDGICVDSEGNIYLAADFGSVWLDVDPGSDDYILTYGTDAGGFILKLNSAGEFVWVKPLSSTITVRSIVLDADDNICYAGSFTGDADFDPSTSTFNVTSTASSDAYVCKLDDQGDFLWVKTIGGTQAQVVESIDTDSYGNIIVGGRFMQTADFDPGAGVYELISASAFDSFLLKLDPSGNFIWVNQVGGYSQDAINSVVVDNNNNIICGGYFYSTLTFGNGTFPDTPTDGSYDSFIFKSDENGSVLWVNTFGGELSAGSDPKDYVSQVVVDQVGNVYATGIFNNTCDFDSNVTGEELNVPAFTDIFLYKADTDGNFIWAKQIKSVEWGNEDFSHGIAIGPAGNVYTCGIFWSPADFDPGAEEVILSSSNGSTFILKLHQDPVGITPNSDLGMTKIYPNPTSDYLVVDLKETTEVTVLNSIGEQVFLSTFESGSNQIDLSGFPAGVYFIQLKQNALIETKKFTKI